MPRDLAPTPSPPSAAGEDATDAHDFRGRRSGPPGARPQTAAAPLPESIGAFRVVARLGEGGMGTVYLAEQTAPMRRQVAIKLIAAGRHDAEALVRFEAERHALARMQHPGIAQVFAAGSTEEGTPYIVMEYVPGVPITHYADGQRLGVDERLELFRRVCQAVQHAHRKGVIHRDLKPSNVLVMEEQGQPLPKVIDFGIARALDPELDTPRVTRDRLLGTPSYLSPEAIQAGDEDADVDTRSDVYSLGVVLYELLVGVLPFDEGKDNLLRLVRRIAEEDPLPPSSRFTALAAEHQRQVAGERRCEPATLTRQLRGELDWIVQRALAKEPGERYGSAADLADDLARHLRREPVAAGPPTAAYRTRKFVQRHKPGVAAALLLLLSLLGGLAARTVEARRAAREAERANRQAERANEAAQEAQRARAQADEVAAFLVDLFEVADPSEGPADTLTVDEVLARGSRRVRAELAGQPLRQALLMETIGTVYRKLGSYSEAETLLEEALAIRTEHLGPNHREVADGLASLVTLRWLQGRLDEAEALARRALAIREAELGVDHPEVAQSADDLALTYRRMGRYDEAIPLFQRAIAIRERSGGPDSVELAESLNGLAILHWNRGDLEEARRLFERAAAIWEHRLGPDHLERVATLNNLAGVYRDLGRPEAAEPLYRQALEIRRRTLPDGHPAVAYSLGNLGLMYRDQGRHGEAESMLSESLAIWEAALGPTHPEVAFALNNLALLYAAAGDPERGLPLAERALFINEKTQAAEHPSIASSLNILGILEREAGRLERAEELHRRALALYRRHDAEHPRVAWALHSLATTLLQAGRLSEAASLYREALALRERRLGPEHPEARESRQALADLERRPREDTTN